MTDRQPRAPVPLFSYYNAVQKGRMIENAWSGRDPAKVTMAYMPDTKWRNQSEFLNGRGEMEAFLGRKWATENGYRLIKENWAFDALGYMAVRHASINHVPSQRQNACFIGMPPGPRPDDHPSLTDLGL